MPERKKLVVLGGGVGSMTAVFELTSQPDWRERFESITVYQLGWRLGGKGASGRGVDGRIEEHGLHAFMGFYDNAFRVIRRAYEELDRPPGAPLATCWDAFKPHNFVVFGDHVRDARRDEWQLWPVTFPANHLRPGDTHRLPSLWEYFLMGLDMVQGLFHRLRAAHPALEESPHCPGDWLRGALREVVTGLEAGVLVAGSTVLGCAVQLARSLPLRPGEHREEHHSALEKLLEDFVNWLKARVASDVDANPELRHLFIMLDLSLAALRGLLADGVIGNPEGLTCLDRYDYREWLRKHGATELSCTSGAVASLYDMVFAYRDGRVDQANFAAGVAMRCVLRTMFTCKGALFWKMQAGMGDTVFGPLYEVLRRRGVEFKFFHAVRNVGPSRDGERIGTLRIGRQVTVKEGEYRPLVDVKGLPCWPSEPDYEQLVEGGVLRGEGINLESFWTPWQDVEEITLHEGEDFDAVLLGVSIASLPYVCPELIGSRPRWREMVEGVETTRTLAAQLWMRPTVAELGWTQESPILDAYAEPWNTWGDMTHLLPREEWPGTPPRSLAYFCGPLPGGIPPESEHDFPERELEAVKESAAPWFDQYIGLLWPNALRDGRFDRDLVQSDYWRVNLDPSERYVLSLAGTTHHRLKSGDSGFANLYLAGDWTDNGFNSGCVEAAVMSGMQASHALCGYPRLEEIVGYGHP